MKKFDRIYVEIGNVCNLACHFCPPVERNKKLMAPKDFNEILNQIRPFTDEICLHLMGEPLAHPHFNEIVEMAEAKDLRIMLTTNGTLLNEKNLPILLKKCFRQINFSVHSFESNFPNKPIETYLEKLFSFIEEADKLHPDLYINFRLWNLQTISPLQSNEKIINLITKRFSTNLNLQTDIRRKKSIKVYNRFYLHFDTEFEWPNENLPFLGNKGTCKALSNHIGIHADGTVVPCCLDKEAKIPLGNVFQESFENILNSERALEMLKGFQNFQLKEKLCQHCSYVERFKNQESKFLTPRPTTYPSLTHA